MLFWVLFVALCTLLVLLDTVTTATAKFVFCFCCNGGPSTHRHTYSKQRIYTLIHLVRRNDDDSSIVSHIQSVQFCSLDKMYLELLFSDYFAAGFCV